MIILKLYCNDNNNLRIFCLQLAQIYLFYKYLYTTKMFVYSEQNKMHFFILYK
jgi:hypothetical protein